jgi:hypothetical protein
MENATHFVGVAFLGSCYTVEVVFGYGFVSLMKIVTYGS